MSGRPAFGWIVLVVSLTGCGAAQRPADTAAPTDQTSAVVVTSRVMQQFVTAVWADTAPVVLVAVHPGESRVPDRAVLQQMQNARLVIWHGAGFEPWRDTVSLPSGRQLDLSAEIQEHLLASAGAVAHQHGPDGASQSADVLWAVWLDPDLALRQLKVLQAIVEKQTDASVSSAEALAERLQQLSNQADQLAQRPHRVVIASEQLRYLVRRLGWTVVAVDSQPSVEHLAADSADLLLTLENMDGISDPRHVVIDLCLTEDTRPVIQRMVDNMERLQRASDGVAAETAKTAAASF